MDKQPTKDQLIKFTECVKAIIKFGRYPSVNAAWFPKIPLGCQFVGFIEHRWGIDIDGFTFSHKDYKKERAIIKAAKGSGV